MKKAIMKRWVKALRSGEYDQGQKRLVTINSDQSEHFCCLGVLCNLATEAGVGEWSGTLFRDDVGDEMFGGLPDGVQRWAGITTCNGLLPAQHPDHSLMRANDQGKSFAEIADIIEEHWESL